MHNHSKVGGILTIVSGGLGVLLSLFIILMAVVLLVVGVDADSIRYNYYHDFDEDILTVVFFIYLMWGIIMALLSALAIVGGIFALRKRVWGLALAGSIAGTLTFFPCGIPAIIFTAIGKKEFIPAAQSAPSPVQ
ncbi:MAG: hypothetical protein WC370_09675 [Dehalococcoidales bacterium]|jgi:hypothetical protein